jgi:SulP family sulfate permease
MSAIFAAMFLMVIVLLIAPLTAYLPVAAMGGVILLVAYNLIDFHHIKQIFIASKSETAILITTFLSTLFLELEFAIYLGVLLSLVIFLGRTSTPEIITLAVDPDTSTDQETKLINVNKKPLTECPQLKIIRIDMSIYFGSTNHIQNQLQRISDEEGIKHILIMGSGINFIDLSGAEMLVAEANRLKKMGGGLYFAELKAGVYASINQSCFVAKIGNEYFYDRKDRAIRAIYKKLDKDVCNQCSARIFPVCRS